MHASSFSVSSIVCKTYNSFPPHGLKLNLSHTSSCFKSFSKRPILDSSKLKGFADDNFEFDKNSRKFSKWVGNTVGKGEIACYEQFLFFPSAFSKEVYYRHIKTRTYLGKGYVSVV